MPHVPTRSWYDPTLDAVLHTGADAVRLAHEMPPGVDLATDIETPGLLRQFDINCVTASWQHTDGRVHSVLLDPDRTDGHDEAVRDMYDKAATIILQNGVFDLPALLHSGLITVDQIREKFLDTLLPARMIDTASPMARSLTMLVKRHLGVEELTGGIELAFKAAGYRNRQDGYEGMDIDSPIYRLGAMADTVMTLRLWPVLYDAAIEQQLNHPFADRGCADRVEAEYVVGQMITELRIVGTRVAKGINVDRGALERYADSIEIDRRKAIATLAAVGLEGGKGKESKVIEYLASVGHLPEDWPRTPGGKLKATKDLMVGLGDPIATAQRTLASMDQLTGYLEKVAAQSTVTGRCHPQISVAGASATGRMSIGSPPLQQFSGAARAILTAEDGERMWSIDWSQIEPVTMALLAGDSDFLAPFAAGADLYEPIMRAAGIPRKVAKVLLLQTMYGSGVNKISETIGHTPESAAQLKRQMFAAMPNSSKFMSRVQTLGDTHGKIVTAGKRVLDVDKGFGYKATNYICVTPETPILTSDLRHVPAGTISVGDALVGFDEHRSVSAGRGTGKRFFRTAEVEDVRTLVRPGVRILAGDRETTCSAEHLWLVRCPDENVRLQWVRADELRPGYHEMMSLGVWEQDTSREGGYLAGLYDGEGCLTARPRPNVVFSQKPGVVMDAFTSTMSKLGLTYGYTPRSLRSTSPTDTARVSGLARVMRTLGVLRPERFIARSREVYEGVELHTHRQMESCPVVASVTPIGDIEVVSIQTSTRTMVANGYLSHNCQGTALDILTETIIELDRRGLGDSMLWWMHDEILVSGPPEVAREVQEVMEIVPDFMRTWPGHIDKLRTECEVRIGAAWAEKGPVVHDWDDVPSDDPADYEEASA